MLSSCNNSRESMMYRIGMVVLACAASLQCGGSEKPTETSSKRDKIVLDRDDGRTGRRSHVPDIGDDDDDDDGDLQVEGLKGHLDPYDIQAGVTPHSTKLAACFQAHAKTKKFLGGQVELGFTVAKDGTVKKVQVNKSSVGSWEVEHCLLDESATMSFKKPKGGEADFSLPLDFEARRSSNWWTEEQAEAELGARTDELDACEGEAGVTQPRNVWVTLYIGNRGVIESVGFASPNKEGIEAGWADCAAQKVIAWTLSDPQGKIAKLGFRYKPE